jgi:hypothetical protein
VRITAAVWNWKCAVLSTALRAPLFVAAAASDGVIAASHAAGVEGAFRPIVAGFLGALTQRLSRLEPRWRSTTLVMTVVPATSHLLELIIHRAAGTPHLATAFVLSLSLTLATTAFDLYAMRRGVLVVGSGSASILSDITMVVRLLVRLPAAAVRTFWA